MYIVDLQINLKFKIMKYYLLILLLIPSFINIVKAQENEKDSEEITSIAPVTEQGNNLELAAVLEVFKDSKDLSEFEKKLNDEKIGVNNLDLNGDSLIDYIRVVEQSDDKYRVIILQAVLGDNQFQDVATINVEKVSDEEIKVQVQGDEEIYGENYYVEPPAETHVHVHLWPIWPVIFAPHYVVYRSPYYWGYYPPYWRPFRPVPIHVYHSRGIVVTGRGGFYYSRRVIVRRPPVYHRHHSTVVVTRPYNRNTYNRNPNNGHNSGRTPNNSRNNYDRNTNNRSSNSRNTNNRTSNTRNSNTRNSNTKNTYRKTHESRNNNNTRHRTTPSKNTQTNRSYNSTQKRNSSQMRNNSKNRPSSTTRSRQNYNTNRQRSSTPRSTAPRAGSRRR